MRPGRDNIAAPDLPAGLAWIGERAGVDAGADRRRPGAGPLLRLRPAQQRAHPALPDRVGAPLPRGGPERDRRAVAALPLRRRPGRGRRRPDARSGSSSRSRSTPSTISGAPTAARAGPASSSGASAARSPGSTSARANTWRPRSRSRTSCARSTPCGRCRSRWRRCARPTPPAPGSSPPPPSSSPAAPGSGPGRPARTARSWRSSTQAGGAYATVEGEGEIAVELDGEPTTPIAVDRPRPLRARRAPPPRGATPHPPPHPGSADLVGQLRRRRTPWTRRNA